jgi:hypothetical protein
MLGQCRFAAAKRGWPNCGQKKIVEKGPTGLKTARALVNFADKAWEISPFDPM